MPVTEEFDVGEDVGGSTIKLDEIARTSETFARTSNIASGELWKIEGAAFYFTSEEEGQVVLRSVSPDLSSTEVIGKSIDDRVVNISFAGTKTYTPDQMIAIHQNKLHLARAGELFRFNSSPRGARSLYDSCEGEVDSIQNLAGTQTQVYFDEAGKICLVTKSGETGELQVTQLNNRGKFDEIRFRELGGFTRAVYVVDGDIYTASTSKIESIGEKTYLQVACNGEILYHGEIGECKSDYITAMTVDNEGRIWIVPGEYPPNEPNKYRAIVINPENTSCDMATHTTFPDKSLADGAKHPRLQMHFDEEGHLLVHKDKGPIIKYKVQDVR